MRKNPIRITGAGLSGLTAAINLAKAGFEVEVYEKCSEVGGHYPETAQMLPNWFAEGEVISELEKCNIKINWLNKIEEVEVYLPNQKIVFYSEKIPIGYSVLRGGQNSLERNLAKQAQDLGVKIITNFKNNIDSEIIATGKDQLITLGYGQVYQGNFEPNRVKVFFNPDYTPTLGYCYLFPHHEKVATIKISKRISENEIDLKKNLQNFQKEFLKKEIKEENFLYHFATQRSFKIPKSAIKGNSLLVGEAAGFQDELFRFGMRYAILSGYLAAKSIIENLDYDQLWKKRFLTEFKRTNKVKKIFQALKRKNFNLLPKNLDLHFQFERFKKIWLLVPGLI